MAKIPEQIRKARIISVLMDGLLGQGKVRDTYRGRNEEELLVVASDSVSIFDFVLNALIPMKGIHLTRITKFWFMRVFKDIPNHFILSKDDPFENAVVDLPQELGVPADRSMLVKKAEVLPYEFIFRFHLGGSVYKKYLMTGIVAGIRLSSGIAKWSKLDEPLFTPSTKAPDGHDINITQGEFFAATGDVGRRAVELGLKACKLAYARAKALGILILDTKLEIGVLPDGTVILVDEVVTPDSSRFVKEEEWVAAMAAGRDPEFYDKERVRIWGRTVETPFFDQDGKQIIGINNLDPKDDKHVEFVHSLVVPKEVLDDTSERYREIEEALINNIPLAA